MKNIEITTRDNSPTEELVEIVEKNFKGFNLKYPQAYYLDYEVNEETGIINKNKKVKHYTKDQIERNLKALKNAYFVAQGAASPDEILNFRNKYKIPASTLSIILGFSKNTISNIEKEGITSLPTGRLIKICLENKEVVRKYIQVCDAIDSGKRERLSRKIMETM